ncbi:hypothetical protein GUJ93_ZPchr0001g31154 [Zizania palustris]|uniref:Uncharacterized protein n=1 Tax=Zizania palustris TaxID=103762 RepID=A0A8J5SAZ8_ZIZPA|nr:hypothetical protein GUJ93_ZPchr0001g31154 [Zizania palustris]
MQAAADIAPSAGLHKLASTLWHGARYTAGFPTCVRRWREVCRSSQEVKHRRSRQRLKDQVDVVFGTQRKFVAAAVPMDEGKCLSPKC